jgi:hypothetical protein
LIEVSPYPSESQGIRGKNKNNYNGVDGLFANFPATVLIQA